MDGAHAAVLLVRDPLIHQHLDRGCIAIAIKDCSAQELLKGRIFISGVVQEDPEQMVLFGPDSGFDRIRCKSWCSKLKFDDTEEEVQEIDLVRCERRNQELIRDFGEGELFI